MLFAKPGEYEPCGMFTYGHLGLIVATITCLLSSFTKGVFKRVGDVFLAKL